MLDLNALTSFVLAAEELNFSAVADRRHTAQSAISAQIRKLETTTGKTLIRRGRGQTMSLTPEGAAFLVYARRILALSDEAVETVRTAQSREIIRLGTTVTLALSVVSDVLSAFAAGNDAVQVQIQCDRSDALLARLDQGDIDIAFMMDQGRHRGRAFVHSRPLVWVCSDRFSMPDPMAQAIPLAFLTDGRDLRRYAFDALDEVGLTGRVSHLSPHPVGVRAFVQAGLALTVMPDLTVGPPLRTAPIAFGLPRLAPIALSGYISANAPGPAMQALADRLESATLGRDGRSSA